MSRRGRRALAVSLVAFTVLPSSVSSPASAAPPPAELHLDLTARPNGGIAIVGDSLTYSMFFSLDDSFRGQQWGPIGMEARSARETIDANVLATSGIDGVRHLRALNYDPSIWIIALGTNDFNVLTSSGADTVIDTMMAEIGPGRRVVWVNVFGKPSDWRMRAVRFNERLVAATARYPLLSIADWFTLASQHLGWFVDEVHTNLAGALARNEFVAAAALIQPCKPHVAVPALPITNFPADGASATAVATGRCLVP